MTDDQASVAQAEQHNHVLAPTAKDKQRTRLVVQGLLIAALLGAANEGWHGYQEPLEARDIVATWQRTYARVLDVQPLGTLKKPQTLVKLSYEIKGQPIETSDKHSGHSELEAGQSVAIFVSPADVKKTRIAAVIEERAAQSSTSATIKGAFTGLFVGPMIGGALALVLSFVWIFIQQIRGHGLTRL